MTTSSARTGHERPHRPTSLRDAEAALRQLRRRYWTVRRVSFAIAYHGALAFFLVGPWVVVGVVLWRSGMLKQPRVLPWLPRAAETATTPALEPRALTGQVMTFTDLQATAWVRTAVAAYPQLQDPQVRFVPGAAVVTATLVSQAALPVEVEMLPRLGEQGISVELRDVRVGTLPSAAAEILIRPLLEPILSQYVGQWNAAYVMTGIEVGEGILRVSGHPRQQ